MRTRLNKLLVASLLLACMQLNLYAQLVADGGSAVIAKATDLSPGDLIVGTNAGNTLLTILSPGTVTNANGRIGLNVTSMSNEVLVVDSGAVWNNTGDLYVGDQSAGNSLLVTNGALVSLAGIRIGNTNSAAGNRITITGTNSLLTSPGDVNIG